MDLRDGKYKSGLELFYNSFFYKGCLLLDNRHRTRLDRIK